jgi:MFS transporter, DHA1 family, multidrug resistance protein
MELWRKNLYSLWCAQFMAALGLNLVVPFLPLYLRELGVEGEKSIKIWSGVAFAAPFVVSAFMQPLWGILGDRRGRKPMIVRAMLGLALANLLMGFAQNAPQFLCFRLFQGCLSGFIAPSLALLASSTPPEKTGYALGSLQTALISSLILGPLFGGIGIHFMGCRPIFFGTGLFCLMGAIVVYIFVREEFVTAVNAGKSQLRENFRQIFYSSELRSLFLLLFLVQFSILFVVPFISLYVEYLRIPPEHVGIITGIVFGITGIASAASSPFWGKGADKLGYKKILRIAIFGSIAFLLPQAFVTNAYQLMFLRAGLGFFFAGTIPVINSIIRHSSTEEDRGGIYGIFQSGYLLGNVIGPLAGGLFSAFLGLRTVFLIASAFLCLGPLLLSSIRKENLSASGE